MDIKSLKAVSHSCEYQNLSSLNIPIQVLNANFVIGLLIVIIPFPLL